MRPSTPSAVATSRRALRPAKKSKGSKKSAEDTGGGGPERTLAGLLTEQLAAASVAHAKGSKAPKYVSLGVGAFLASKVEPRSPYYDHLRAEAFQQFQLRLGRQGQGGDQRR